ncbi:hypothetical protein OHW20_02515 [Acinetobacter baumannii]|nr:hypothetical protein [Acinetobacter baumannii]
MSDESINKVAGGEHIKNEIVIKKISNGMTILDNGVIHSFNSESFEIHVNTVVIKFNFVNDHEIKGSGYRAELDKESKKQLNINLVNMNSKFESGTAKPITIAKIKNKTIYMTFFVSKIDEDKEVRAFHYSILIED